MSVLRFVAMAAGAWLIFWGSGSWGALRPPATRFAQADTFCHACAPGCQILKPGKPMKTKARLWELKITINRRITINRPRGPG